MLDKQRCQHEWYDETLGKRVRCLNRKNLKRIDLVFGGNAGTYKKIYREYLCPKCQKKVSW